MRTIQKIACVLFACLIIFILTAPHGSILKTDVLNTYAAPSAEFPLGTDNLGRDVYALILEGGIRTIEVVFLSTAISFLLGTFLGMIGAIWGGTISGAIQIVSDFTMVIPSFIMALIFTGIFGFTPIMAGLVFGIGNMGQYQNQAYQLTLSLKNQEFIDAERVLGLSKVRIMLRHVFPNIVRRLMVFMGSKASGVSIQYAGLAFIGLGADVTNPDWGTMLYQYKGFITTCPRLVIIPACAISAITIFFYLMFDNGASKTEATIYE